MTAPLSSLFTPQKKFSQTNRLYRGRFAPSPSGPLHFGSLIAALGSYLQAKSQQGLWFVRIEDIDKPREQPGAVSQILEGLQAFGMNWDKDENTASFLVQDDRDCLVQTRRLARYQQVLDALAQNDLVYGCRCSRKQIKQGGGLYQGTCRTLGLPLKDHAIRLKQARRITGFNDGLFGNVQSTADFASEDFIVKRRDGLFAYQLVVVLDDIDQGITEVVRGADIMTLTPRQLSLYQLFGLTPPAFVHLPLMVNKPGFKLSKQNHATAIDITEPKPELLSALAMLGLPTFDDLSDGSVSEIIDWATNSWRLANVPKQQEIII